MNTPQFSAYTSSYTLLVSANTPPSGLASRIPASADFRRLLDQFEPSGLAQMDAVALLDRTDTKYVLQTSQLYTALAALRTDYRVLDIDGGRVHPYQTLYFDTNDFAMYMRHHAGRPQRYKVRSRQYVDSHRSFLEVKIKTKKDRTSKRRIETGELVTHFTPEASSFVGANVPLDAQALEPKLWNSFMRITLVNKQEPERLTLDLDLRFDDGRRRFDLPGVAIAEVKQEGVNRHSDFVRQMRAMAIHSTGFSKYCIGTALLYPGVKHNNFKDKLRLLERLMGDDSHVYGTH
jgi:hypothetical protein